MSEIPTEERPLYHMGFMAGVKDERRIAFMAIKLFFMPVSFVVGALVGICATMLWFGLN